MEFSLGNIKITYYFDDGKLYDMTNTLLDITGEKKIIVIESIENEADRLPFGLIQAAKNAFDAFLKANTSNYAIAGRIYIPTTARNNLNDMGIVGMYDIKSALFEELGFCNINTLYNYSPIDIRPYIFPCGKGKPVVDYCIAKDYMTVTDNSLLPICRYHVDGIIKSTRNLDNDPAELATELNDMIEKVIHDFNVAHTVGKKTALMNKESKTKRGDKNDN